MPPAAAIRRSLAGGRLLWEPLTRRGRGFKEAGSRDPTDRAQVAELVDALASGASGLTAVKVRVLSWAPSVDGAELFPWRHPAGGAEPFLGAIRWRADASTYLDFIRPSIVRAGSSPAEQREKGDHFPA